MSQQSSLFNEKKSKNLSPDGSQKPKLVIIDGHNLAFRSYHAVKRLSSSQGQATNAIYGFLRSLIAILKAEGEHDATVITFDAPAKTFRHEQYSDYKAQRSPMPEDLPKQIEIIKELVNLMGLYQIEVAGLEADDLFGTMAKKCAALGYQVEVITSDRDAFQLIDEAILIHNPIKGVHYDEAKVFAEHGVKVSQWIDYRALTGDTSDNIPGAKGIGPVTAARLLKTYSTLDYILEHLDEIQPKKEAQKIAASKEDVLFSRELSKILTDADIAIEPQLWAKRQADDEKLSQKLKELEFHSLLRELNLAPASTPLKQETLPLSQAKGEILALGYLLSHTDPLQAELLSLSAYHEAETEGRLFSSKEAQEQLDFLKQANLSACDAKALALYAQSKGLELLPEDDPLLLAYVIDPDVTDISTLVARHGLGEWTTDSGQRARLSAQLWQKLSAECDEAQHKLYQEIEKPLAKVLCEMEFYGVVLDGAVFESLSAEMSQKLSDLEYQVREIADNPLLNLNSRDQLATLLFDTLKLRAGKRTSTGKQSTAVAVLEQLRDAHPVVNLILDYRELAKLRSTYLEPLPKMVNSKTGRLHTTFSQTTAVTGRLSSLNPNLQNIPIRSDIGRQIRKGFIAAEGYKLLVADYSQIELRVLAHIADEPALIAAFQKGADIHASTAASIYGVPLNEVQSGMRRIAKTINFGVLYGMGAHRLSRELSIDYAEAELFIKSYFANYPNIQNYIDRTLSQAREYGYVESLLGRRRKIPDILSSNRNVREYAERTAYNMPIQGSAADIMKLAMLALHPQLKEHGAKMLLQVHDELIFEVPED
ncbi:MAG: DNA polymerase I, partial [Deinococcales bacterium]